MVRCEVRHGFFVREEKFFRQRVLQNKREIPIFVLHLSLKPQIMENLNRYNPFEHCHEEEAYYNQENADYDGEDQDTAQ